MEMIYDDLKEVANSLGMTVEQFRIYRDEQAKKDPANNKKKNVIIWRIGIMAGLILIQLKRKIFAFRLDNGEHKENLKQKIKITFVQIFKNTRAKALKE